MFRFKVHFRLGVYLITIKRKEGDIYEEKIFINRISSNPWIYATWWLRNRYNKDNRNFICR